MEEHQLSTEGVRFHQADEPEKAVTLATRLVLEGEVDYLMKGGLETRTMMKRSSPGKMECVPGGSCLRWPLWKTPSTQAARLTRFCS